jgi:hypothetical protein
VLTPFDDELFLQYVAHPEFASLLTEMYPGQFPHLTTLNNSHTPPTSRADLLAILLTGIPAGLISGFQNNTGPLKADMLRLNVAIPPTENPNMFGALAGDLAGYPNGRRVADDVVTIEVRALAGATYPLVDKTYEVDAAAGELTDAVTPPEGPSGYLSKFPYLGMPHSGHARL